MVQNMNLTDRRFFNEITSKPQPVLPAGAKRDQTAPGEHQRERIRGDAVAGEHE
ncbi:MAG: hypothetical protein ABSB50_09485 [Terracidiphilus sp.]|jgi:hypothetical protein